MSKTDGNAGIDHLGYHPQGIHTLCQHNATTKLNKLYVTYSKVPESLILRANGYEHTEIPTGVFRHTLLESVW
jgi:hypothetical protein